MFVWPGENKWEVNINMVSQNDKVLGGQNGPSTAASIGLANRTVFLKGEIDTLKLDMDSLQQDVSDFLLGNDLNSHISATNPHPQYLTVNEHNQHISATNPHSQYLLASNIPSQTEAEAGTSTTVRAWSALRVKQAATEAANSAIINFGINVLPVGCIIPFAAPTTIPAPVGFHDCDGSLGDRSTYISLFNVIGITYGAGDGSTTFNFPDLRGEFIRGFDDGRGIDVGRTFGSLQLDEFKSHTHVHTPNVSTAGPAGGGFINGYGHSGSRSTSATGGNETRPRNIAMRYIIKV